jgi:DNA polymerase III subunit epsilon
MQVLIFDTETTGLIQNRSLAIDKQPEVIELCAFMVNLKTGKIITEFETLVKPVAFPMTPQIMAETKTQLSNEMLSGAKSFKELAPKIKSIMEAAPIVLAHNASFDQEMLDIEYERLGQKLKWPPLYCTVEQTVHLKGRRLNLTNLHIALLGKPFEDAHRARNDVMALTRCAIEMFKRGLL